MDEANAAILEGVELTKDELGNMCNMFKHPGFAVYLRVAHGARAEEVNGSVGNVKVTNPVILHQAQGSVSMIDNLFDSVPERAVQFYNEMVEEQPVQV